MAGEVDPAAYRDALVVLGTAGVLVPVLNRFRVSPVLGFLAAGALLGPGGLGSLREALPALSWVTIGSPDQIANFSQLGVVFLLFLIGLEVSAGRLLTMRRLVFGLGGAQVLTSAVVISSLAMLVAGMPPASAIVIGAALSLSSTAIVVEVLSRQKRLASTTGRVSFSILLFQDLAVVPILILISVLDPANTTSLAVSVLTALGQAAVALAAIVVVGRFLLRPLFRLVAHAGAESGSQDLFIATTLFVAVGTGFVTAAAGLSMALGAFVAGLLLAETEYRRAIETVIEPIKSLLLGVFFFSVGLSLDIGALIANPLLVVGLALALIAIQGTILFGLCRLFGIAAASAIETAALLAPGGEFAFVVITLAVSKALIATGVASTLLTSVSLSMALIPVLAIAGRALRQRWKPAVPADPVLAELPPEDGGAQALVVGYGRVGELICEMLTEHKVPYIAVERLPQLVTAARDVGRPVYFGDVRQIDLLRRCGLDTAKAAIITIHGEREIDEIVAALRQAYPKLLIVARARDAQHARHLYALGVDDAVPETIEASLQLSEAALVGLGVPTGPVIASIHEKRDVFRATLQSAAKGAGRTSTAFPKRRG